MYLNSINHFRAIAIIIIVLGHCFWLIHFNHHSVFANTIYNLIIGGTSFFVFISGFLFHHVIYKRYDFKTFFVKQSKHVLIPYLIISSIPILELLLTWEVGKTFVYVTLNSALMNIILYSQFID